LKILILKPSSLGDVVHAIPVLRLLKLHLPQSEIYWWLEAGLVPLLKDDPDLAGIIPFHRKRWAAPQRWPEIYSSVREMRRRRFDWAIDLQGLARSGVFTWLANAQLNVGLGDHREGAQAAYDLLTPSARPGMHAVDRYLSVLPTLGVPVHSNFTWLPDRPLVAAQVQEKWNPGTARWVTLLPGARWMNKRWPVQNFVEVARRLISTVPDLKIAILGSRDDQALGHEISRAGGERCLDLTGKTSLPEMIEWIRISELVITNDTGPMHVAAALKRPIIALFGPTDPDDTGPYGQRHNVIQVTDLPCVPCLKDYCSFKEPLACLHGIAQSTVYERARETLLSGALVR
jgi:heptosyltransferase I